MGIPGLSGPLLQFVHGNARTLEMELFFDTYEENRQGSSQIVNQAGADVRDQVMKVVGLMTIDPTTHAPPVIEFHWASLSFTCVVTRASQKFTMFLPSGRPVRATVQVTFQEYINAELENTRIGRQTADYTKRHLVRQGDSLASIAAVHYGDASQWRPIAAWNQIDDPRQLEVGRLLAVPRLPLDDVALQAVAEGRVPA
jgi:nucleoid-associated protein YgaU